MSDSGSPGTNFGLNQLLRKVQHPGHGRQQQWQHDGGDQRVERHRESGEGARDGVVLVSDDAIRDAQRRLWHDAHLVAEPGGAASLAGLIAGGYRPAADERVVVVVCGANTDPASVV